MTAEKILQLNTKSLKKKKKECRSKRSMDIIMLS